MSKRPNSATAAIRAQASLALVAKAACSITEPAADTSGGSRSSPIASAAAMSPAIRRWRMGFGMTAGAPVEDRIDQRDTDRAAEVSHHIEQAACIRHLLMGQRLQRKPGRRQQAKHRCEAPQNLRPEHLGEIGDTTFERAQTQSKREQAKAKSRQPARIQSALQRAGNRRGHELRNSRYKHDRADLERIVLPDIGEKYRHQIDRAEQSYPRQKLSAQPIEKDRTFSVASSTTGCTAFSVLTVKRAAATTQSANRPKQTPEDQPYWGACFKPISRLANETAISAREIPSKFFNWFRRGLPRGSRNGVAVTAMMPGPTLIRNNQGQE